MFAHTHSPLSPQSSSTDLLWTHVRVSQCCDFLLQAIRACPHSRSEPCDSFVNWQAQASDKSALRHTQPHVLSITGALSCSANIPTKIHMQFLSLCQRDQPHNWHFNNSPADRQGENFIVELKPLFSSWKLWLCTRWFLLPILRAFKHFFFLVWGYLKREL